MATARALAYKELARQQWQTAAEAWHRWDPTLREWLSPATQIMLDLAGIGQGSRVLDVAAGAGEPAMTAAHRVSSTGRVVATDISSNILAHAESAARAQQLNRVMETRVMDGENLEPPEESFDAVSSRLGVMYFPDRQRGLAEMHRVLRADGRVAVVVFGPPEKTNSSRSRSRSSGCGQGCRCLRQNSRAHSAWLSRGYSMQRSATLDSGTWRSGRFVRLCGWTPRLSAHVAHVSRLAHCKPCWSASPKPSAKQSGPKSPRRSRSSKREMGSKGRVICSWAPAPDDNQGGDALWTILLAPE
jgi:SAM-dependent methyltransferase